VDGLVGGGSVGATCGGTVVGSLDSLEPNRRWRKDRDFWLEMENALWRACEWLTVAGSQWG
jgi:hypothetical protein